MPCGRCEMRRGEKERRGAEGGVQQLPKQRRVRETPEEVDLNVGKCISADTSLSYK